jgi:hypothetical protein
MEEEIIIRPRLILSRSDLIELNMLLGKIQLRQYGDRWGIAGQPADLAQFIVHLHAVTGSYYETLLLATGVVSEQWGEAGTTRNVYLFPGLEVA